LNRSQLELFCDRSLGRIKVPTALRLVHPTVIAHDDVFPQDTDDEVWLREAGRRGWVVLMRDDRIRYRPAEQAAVIAAGVRCFCLHPSKNMMGEDMAESLTRALPKLLSIASREAGGYIKGVNRTGRIRHLFP
jgi:hypothetical protein